MQTGKEAIKIAIDDRGVLLQLFDMKNNKISFDGQITLIYHQLKEFILLEISLKIQ
jgi:hypothetical protein